MRLSILMATTFDRAWKWQAMQQECERQAHQFDAEFLVLTDNRKQSLGAKCNALVRAASGQYCVIVDDDDRIDDDFVELIVAAAMSEPSCVVYPIVLYVNGEKRAMVHTSIKCVPRDDWPNGMLYRRPDKKMAIRRDIMLAHPFPDRWAGSDWRQARNMRRSLETEVFIPRPLYHYYVRTDNQDCREEAVRHGEYANAAKGMEKEEEARSHNEYR